MLGARTFPERRRRRTILRRLLSGLALPGALSTAPARGQAAPAGSAGERRIALVIGNGRYPAIPLVNPENDARLIATNLRTLGFDVNLQLNLDVREFRRILRDFARRMQEEDGSAVLYYAGHGVQIDGRNYLLPVDINLRDEEEIKDDSIDIDELFVSRIERARAKVRIVILDACRDNPFGTKTRGVSTSGGLAEMAARGTLIAYASAPGAPAEDGPPGTNSIYTRNLAREMMVQGLEVEQMFKRVRVDVLRDTQDRQVPWVNTSLTVNFSFNPGPAQLAADASAAAAVAEREKLQAEIEQMRQALKQAQSARPAASGPQATASPPPQATATDPSAPSARPPAEPARPSATPPVQTASLARRGLTIRLRADTNLNTDGRNLSAPVAVRLYLLRSPDSFRGADFLSLFERDQVVLGRDLASREELFLRPGQSLQLTRELPPDVRSIAVFVAFRQYGDARWRAVDTIPVAPPSSDDATTPIRIDVGARDVRVSTR